jgi:hypothetical protein
MSHVAGIKHQREPCKSDHDAEACGPVAPNSIGANGRAVSAFRIGSQQTIRRSLDALLPALRG